MNTVQIGETLHDYLLAAVSSLSESLRATRGFINSSNGNVKDIHNRCKMKYGSYFLIVL